MNRKLIAPLLGLGLAGMVAGPALASNQTNPGARVAQLSPQNPSNDSDAMHCNVGTGSGNGFVMFNAPGKPGSAVLFEGEVALKNADPGATYAVFLQKNGSGNNDMCNMVGTLTTNTVGNGNDHIDTADTNANSGVGSYYVVLKEMTGPKTQPQFATPQVTIS